MSVVSIAELVKIVLSHYDTSARAMPWREPEPDGTFDPYKIMVSEIMLQQTQADRVIPKYLSFLRAFPTLDSLAKASFSSVLAQWSGLGYSRRAKYLHDIAKQCAGRGLPDTIDELVAFKGVGYNTAAAILTYAHNQRHAYIETNIRTVYLYHFFTDQDEVADSQILPLVEQSLDHLSGVLYRDFYLGLMDYGSHLKKLGVKNNAQSKHYTKQSRFDGSLRQLRGKVLRELQKGSAMTTAELQSTLQDERALEALDQLAKDGLVQQTDNGYIIAS